MGQATICSICAEEKEKEENLKQYKSEDFFISETKLKNIDHPTLKSQKLDINFFIR